MNTRALTALASIVTLGAVVPVRADFFGPDGAGNSATDNVPVPAGMQPMLDLGDFQDISSFAPLRIGSVDMAGELVPVDDAISSTIALPAGFNFSIYGEPYSEIVVSSNGFIAFSTGISPDLSNDCPLPQPVPGGGERIYVLHDDLVSVVYTAAFNAGAIAHPSGVPLRSFVVQWKAQHFPVFGDFTPFSFEAILFERVGNVGGEILLLYDDQNAEHGFGSTTGIQNATNSDGLTIHCNASNSIVDDYAVFIRPYEDCNNNFIPDDVEVADPDRDCNGNGVPDECDVDPTDPDGNGAVSQDIDNCGVGVGEPDECEPDCNENGIPDSCDISPFDPDGNGMISGDCNDNGIPDECDIESGLDTDCNGNGTPDHCEIPAGSPAPGGPFYCAVGCSPDCNVNGIPDDCEEDCNRNGIPDDCDTEPESDPAAAVPMDDCADAMLIDPAFPRSGSTLGATNDGPGQCNLYYGGTDVWYRYRPAWSGSLFVSASGTPLFGTNVLPLVISAHDGCPATVGNRLACSESSPGWISFNVVKEETYWIRLAGRGFGEAVNFEMRLIGPDGALNLDDLNNNRVPDICECLADVNGDGTVDSLDFVQVMSAYGPCDGCPEDVDGSGTVDDEDLAEVLENQGDCPF